MIIVLMLISIVIIIIEFVFGNIDDEFTQFVIPSSVIAFLIKLGILVYLLTNLVGLRVIDDKIELYENQNKEIENKVELVVKQYMEHENKTLIELKSDDSYITLVTLYPDLKSDKLIEQEIALYEENNKKIIGLKEQKINKKVYQWWIYFGGK